jgi:hypothetical protein
MKTNKETALASSILSPDGRMMAKCLMEEDGISIERLFNLLGQFQSDIMELQRELNDARYEINRELNDARYEINYHIRHHD